MTKEERLELLRQERITRELMTHVVDSMYESEYSILFDLQNEIIEDKGRETSYPYFFDEINVSDSFFSNDEFINMTLAAYANCQFEGAKEDKFYLPPSLMDMMEHVSEYYEEIIINTAQENVEKIFIEENKEDEIGGEEFVEQVDTEYEMLCECVYSYECADMEYRICSVLDNFGLAYIMEVYGTSPFMNEHYFFEGISNSSKRLLFEEYSSNMLTDLAGSVDVAPNEGGEINVTEDVERGYIANIRAVMAFDK